MLTPIPVFRLFRFTTSGGLIAVIVVITAVFSTTPLVMSTIAERYGVSVSVAGLFSAAQLGSFVIGSFAAGRYLRAERRWFVAALAVLALANAVSILPLAFAWFVAGRAFAGLSMGVLTWLAWSQAFGDRESQGDLSVVGPLAGVVISPVLGVLLQYGDDRWVYAALGVAAAACLAAPTRFEHTAAASSRRSRPVPQAVVLIAALGLLTMGGSAVFIYSGVHMTEELGMSPAVVSFVYSLNALAGVPSARWRGRRPLAGAWIVVTAACAIWFSYAGAPWEAWVTLGLWGFAFQAGVPGVFSLLATRSAHPADRAGDAQAVMAFGRTVGPLFGGAVIGAGAYPALGLSAGLLMAAAGVAALVVERGPGLPSPTGTTHPTAAS